jgi:peptide/nickel transport system permease protein
MMSWLSTALTHARGWLARYRRQPGATAGLALALAVLVTAVFAPQIAPFPPKLTAGAALQPPSALHLFGTDDLGRDTFSNVIYGARVALVVGLTTALTAAVIGTLVGLVAGYAGGRWDDLLMRLTETFQLLPRFFLALLLVSLLGSDIVWIALLLGLTFWPATARLLRSQVLSVRSREHVVAARAVGVHERAIMLRHVLPLAFAPVIISAARMVAGAILTEASLSFLGLGDPTLVSWGQLLSNAQRFIRTAWWLFVFPGAALALTVLATTLVADGLVAALRPSSARR